MSGRKAQVRKMGKRYKAVKCSGRRGKAVGILAKTRKRVSAVSKVWGQPERFCSCEIKK